MTTVVRHCRHWRSIHWRCFWLQNLPILLPITVQAALLTNYHKLEKYITIIIIMITLLTIYYRVLGKRRTFSEHPSTEQLSPL